MPTHEHTPTPTHRRPFLRVDFWRWLLLALLVCLCLQPTLLLAQDGDADTPAETLTAAELQALVERVEAAAEDAERALEKAAETQDLAFNMLGLFEAIGVLIGIITGVLVPVIAVIGGFLGLRRLESAQRELAAARTRFEQDLEAARDRFEGQINEKEAQLDALRDQLQAQVKGQQAQSEQAMLALSLLPIGERQYRAQNLSGALDTYRRALSLSENNPVIHYRVGYVLTQSGELAEAQEHLNRAMEIDEEFAPALATLGYVYRRIGEKMEIGPERDSMMNKAESMLLDALRMSPKLVDEDGESWWGSLGGLYRRRNQVDEAIRAYKRASEVTPHSSYAFSNLALLYMQQANREAMITTYRRVEQLAAGEVSTEPDNYWAHADLLVARLALNDIDGADKALGAVYSTAPGDSPYFLESLVDTLTRLAVVVESERATKVHEVIRNIQRHRAQLGHLEDPVAE